MGAQLSREENGLGRVAVHANRFRLDRKLSPVDRHDDLFLKHSQNSSRCRLRVVEKSVGPCSGDKRAVGKIIAIGKNFSGDAELMGRSGFSQDARTGTEKDQGPIDRDNCLHRCFRDRVITRRHVVKSPVQFQMTRFLA